MGTRCTSLLTEEHDLRRISGRRRDVRETSERRGIVSHELRRVVSLKVLLANPLSKSLVRKKPQEKKVRSKGVVA